MGSAEMQGKLWGKAVADYAEINEGFRPGTLFLDAG